MASTYTTGFGIEKIAAGEQSDTWGTTTNHNLDILDRIASYKAVALSGTTHTLTVREASPGSGTENLQDGMYRVIKFTGALGGNNTVTIAPNTSPAWFIIENATTDSGSSGPYTVILTQGSGANVTVQNGKNAIIYCDGAGSGAVVYDALSDLQVGTLEVTGAAAVDGALTAAAVSATTLTTSGIASVDDTTDSTSGTTGSIHTDGGVGVAKALYVGTTSKLVGVTTHGGNVVSDTDSTDDLGTTGVRWRALYVDAITATDQITATGFTGTLDGILGSGSAAAASVTTITSTGDASFGGSAATGVLNAKASSWSRNSLTLQSANDAGSTNFVGIAFVNNDSDSTVQGVANIYTNPTGELSLTTLAGINFKQGSSGISGGTSAFAISSTALSAANAAGPAMLQEAATQTNPTLIPHRGSLTTGWGGNSGNITAVVGGVEQFRFAAGNVSGAAANAPTIKNATPTATNPVFVPSAGDQDTGMGWVSANIGSLVAGGVEALRWANGTVTIAGQAIATGFTGTLDGVLGSGAAAAASVTTLGATGVISAADGSVSAPSISFSSDTNNGLAYINADNWGLVVGGAWNWYFQAAQNYTNVNLYALNAAGPGLLNEVPTSTNPSLVPNRADLDTGIGWVSADIGSLVAGGVSALSWNASADVGIKHAAPLVSLHVQDTALSGSDTWTADVQAVFGRNGNAGLAIYAPAANAATIKFAKPSDYNVGQLSYSFDTDVLNFTLAATSSWDMAAGSFAGANAAGPALLQEAATATNPTLAPNKADPNTGVGWVSADIGSLVAGGVEALRWQSSGVVSVPATVMFTDNNGPSWGSSWMTGNAASQFFRFYVNSVLEGQVDATGVTVGNAAGPSLLNEAASATNPTLVPNKAAPTVGIGAASATTLSLIAAATEVVRINSTTMFFKGSGGIECDNAAGAKISNVAPTATVPTLIPNKTDANTGVGWVSADIGSLVAGGVSVLNWQTNGAVTMPVQPAFSTTLASTATNVTGNSGTAYVIAWDTEIFDQGADVSGATFTAPVAGRYLLTFFAQLNDMAAGATRIRPAINTSNRVYNYDVGDIPVDANARVGIHLSVLADMDAADTATTAITVTGLAGDTVDVAGVAESGFQGYLVA